MMEVGGVTVVYSHTSAHCRSCRSGSTHSPARWKVSRVIHFIRHVNHFFILCLVISTIACKCHLQSAGTRSLSLPRTLGMSDHCQSKRCPYFIRYLGYSGSLQIRSEKLSQSQVQSSATVYQPPFDLQLSLHRRSLDILRPTCLTDSTSEDYLWHKPTRHHHHCRITIISQECWWCIKFVFLCLTWW